MRTTILITAMLACAGTAAAQSAPNAPDAQHGAVIALPAGIEWQPAPPSLPPGARIAVLDGDPTEPGPFTMRLWMPAGYRIAPHMHPADEHVTVISGTFHIGMGPSFDEAAGSALPAGGYAALRAEMPHFAWTRSETVIQLNNIGPWSLKYVDPADDPRSRR